MAGVEAVVDVLNGPAGSRDEAVGYFGTTTRKPLGAEERAGVRHHVLLSIVGVDRVEGNTIDAGKREQPDRVRRRSWTSHGCAPVTTGTPPTEP